MEERIYDYWVSTLQDGYIGNIVNMTEAVGGAKSLYELFRRKSTGSNIDSYLSSVIDNNGKVMFTKSLIEHFSKNWRKPDIVEKEYYNLMNDSIFYVNYNDSDFPEKLNRIASRPYGIFVKGNLPVEGKKSVAIVGARECSEYGRICAEYFGDRLAREGVQIISGMAWGIDGISQMSAVMAGGKSFGVLGCGVDVIYPKKNAGLYKMLCENGNGIISEYAPHTQAISRLFPPRNRIISGLCDVLLVVEARAKSGTLITVNMAMEQGKTIMVIPGRITDELSRGCLMLMNEGAMPAVSVESVLEELGMVKDRYSQIDLNSYYGSLSDTLFDEKEKEVYKILSIDPISSETICERTKIPINEVLVILSKLEIKGCAKEVAKNFFLKA